MTEKTGAFEIVFTALPVGLTMNRVVPSVPKSLQMILTFSYSTWGPVREGSESGSCTAEM